MPTTTHLPVAVYGTLRPGGGNDRLWRERAAEVAIGRVYGFRLVTNGAFPYALPATDAESVVVSVLALDDEDYDETLSRLDRLEGVPHHYGRHVVMVRLADETVEAFMYVPRGPDSYASLRSVPGNDWDAVICGEDVGWRR